ncbi:MAG: PPC domain-containing DNA-binding protein [Nostoc sp. ChiSLP01]|nr:DNA-binding protein [Nostoc sp. CmiSLP01]MDZ8289154.1 DNA-binding protein [Nostoc sp. ChiSLP01]
MKVFALRLKPRDDLKESLKNFVIQEDIKAGFILSAIGSLEEAKIRFTNQVVSTVLTEKFEIIALNGTIANTDLHLHIAISDGEGKTIGGHLDYGCIIYTTAEIVIDASQEFTFNRKFDEQTGYQELEIIRGS